MVLIGERLKLLCWRRAAPQMDTDDSGGPWRNHAPHGLRIEIVRRRIDVGENRCDLLPLQCVCGRDEGVGGNDDLPLEFQRACRNLQRDRTVAHCHAMRDAEIVGDLALELLYDGTVVR